MLTDNLNPAKAAALNATKTDMVAASRSGSIQAVERLIPSLREAAAVSGAAKATLVSAVVSGIFDGHADVVNVLLEKTGLAVDSQGVTGNSMLHWAATWCRSVIGESFFCPLLPFLSPFPRHPSDPAPLSSPLLSSPPLFSPPCPAVNLLGMGADYTLLNANGHTALAIARSNGCTAVVTALRAAGAVV